MSFADHFSTQARDYARFRPTYPAALFAELAARAPAHEAVWDCATGSGQAALPLAEHFARVLATDGAQAQLEHAQAHPRVVYTLGTAEESGLPDQCVDAVAVAQAAHWFDLPRFTAECRRVARPGAPVVLWGYTLAHVGPAVDGLLDAFYAEVEPYWPPGRERLDAGYEHLVWDLEELALPPVAMTAEWPVAGYLGYLGTWSAVARARAAGHDPLAALVAPLGAAWGAGLRTVTWPLTLRAGRV